MTLQIKHRVPEKVSQNVLSYILQNWADSSKIWSVVFWINLSQNISSEEWILSLHLLVRLRRRVLWKSQSCVSIKRKPIASVIYCVLCIYMYSTKLGWFWQNFNMVSRIYLPRYMCTCFPPCLLLSLHYLVKLKLRISGKWQQNAVNAANTFSKL